MSSSSDPPPAANLLARLHQRAKADNRNYLTRGHTPEAASVKARSCPQCGATRTDELELLACTRCGYTFLRDQMSDGVYLKKPG